MALDVKEAAQRQKKHDLAALRRRDDELSALFDKALAGNMAGTISDTRFKEASDRYDTEQAQVRQSIRELEKELDKEKDRALTTSAFLAIVRKYTRARKLTSRMLNELVEHIEVHHAEKIDSVHVQRITIHLVGKGLAPSSTRRPRPGRRCWRRFCCTGMAFPSTG